MNSHLHDNRDGQYSSGDRYWQLWSNNYVQCSETMEYLAINSRLYRDGKLAFDNADEWCYNDRGCWNSWFYHYDNLAGHCYQAWTSFIGQWHNPATNELQNYAGEKWSNKLCF